MDECTVTKCERCDFLVELIGGRWVHLDRFGREVPRNGMDVYGRYINDHFARPNKENA